ncbi:hypothetical protein GUJ93_ZPchr0003g17749 [Zizania palustris]|uniref:Uncharacterized protein n=1 Tax=Zizania palustris TaxID=103762 RepID=A0A8J5VEE6_ZIZPA|nr:hypothetical protein GUJ93_ZPchr0003g17749 [Zizania palustris]KAG8063226.1 hypothetical protein GUJ93_ZPchr0003g17749 [Zizania palustris]
MDAGEAAGALLFLLAAAALATGAVDFAYLVTGGSTVQESLAHRLTGDSFSLVHNCRRRTVSLVDGEWRPVAARGVGVGTVVGGGARRRCRWRYGRAWCCR